MSEKIDFESFVEAASKGVLRALDARQREGGSGDSGFSRTIICGIWPFEISVQPGQQLGGGQFTRTIQEQ